MHHFVNKAMEYNSDVALGNTLQGGQVIEAGAKMVARSWDYISCNLDRGGLL